MDPNGNVEMQRDKWFFAFASVIGNSHITDNLPCQDACHVEQFDTFSVAIVADGAGSCKNSHIGSKQVVEFCVYHFAKLINEQDWVNDFPNKEVWYSAAKETLRSVRMDLEKYSITNDLPFKSLACTVILALCLPDGLLVSHIGDGRAGYFSPSTKWKAMIMPFHGQEANETVFITSDIWDDDTLTDRYVESLVINEPVDAFCLLSDGCEKSSFEVNLYDTEKKVFFDPNRPFAPFLDPNRTALLQFSEQQKSQEDINALWAKFLTDGTEKLRIETDDKTLLLGVRKAELPSKANIDDAKAG